jgi:hypothetical protein
MNYARIVGNVVVEVIPTMLDEAGETIEISQRYHPDFVATLVEIPKNTTVMEGDSYEDGIFSPPKTYEPSIEEIILLNKQQQDYLLSVTALRLAPLQYAVNLGIATEQEQSQLISWKEYSVYVNRVDLTNLNPDWPHPPEV